MFSFSEPLYLTLLVLPAALARYRLKKRPRPALRVSRTLPEGTVPASALLRLLPVVRALKYAALVLMILAMAGPRWGEAEIIERTEGINIVLAVDVSGTMAALDFTLGGRQVNRLDAVKAVVREFVSGRNGDRIGLIAFGSEAYTMCPLTRDYAAVAGAVERLTIGAAGRLTALGDALGAALKRLGDVPSKTNVVVLLTDGRSNTGEFSPETASLLAAKAGVKVYTIAVGGDKPAPFIMNDPLFGRHVVMQAAEADTAALARIAEETGGRFFRAEDTGALEQIYATIGELEKTEVETGRRADYNDLHPWFLFPAFCLLVLWAALVNTRFLRLP